MIETSDRLRPAVVIFQPKEALGDAITSLASYRALRLAFPDHRIVAVYTRDTVFRDSLQRVAGLFLDQILVNQPIDKGIGSIRRVLRAIPSIDLLIETRPNIRALWSLLASAGLVRRFISNTPAYFPAIGTSLPELRPKRHAMRRHRLVELAAGRTLPFDASLPEQVDAAAHARALLPLGPTYVGVVPGPANSDKYWPTERHREFAAGLNRLGVTPVYILGLFEGEHRGWIEVAAPGAVIVDLPEARSDPSYMPWLVHAVAGRWVAAVAVEGGLGHLIATRGGCLLTLAGPTNPLRWHPVTQRWWVIRAQQFGSQEMQAIPVAAALRSVEEMLAWPNGLRAVSPDAYAEAG
jgi:ADP-heptose:LPS heptosyltransferase